MSLPQLAEFYSVSLSDCLSLCVSAIGWSQPEFPNIGSPDDLAGGHSIEFGSLSLLLRGCSSWSQTISKLVTHLLIHSLF